MVLIGTVLIRWPLVGFLIGSVTGDPTAWHKDSALVRLCSRLTLLLALPCVLRVVVQYPLWLGGEDMVGWLGTAKIVAGLAAAGRGAGGDGVGARPQPHADRPQPAQPRHRLTRAGGRPAAC